MLKRRALATLLPLLWLGGCIFGDQGNFFEKRVNVGGPFVMVSNTEAAIGEFVEVAITTKLMAKSKVQEIPAEVGLGVCLYPDWLGDLDNCKVIKPNVISFEPSENFTVAPRDNILKCFTLDIKRDETYELSHTFSLTANRAGTVTLIGRFESYDHPEVPGDVPSVGPEEQAVVTFK